MEPVAAAEPADVELLRTEPRSDPAVGEHRPVAVGRDERHDDAVAALLDRPEQLDSALDQLCGGELAGRVGAPLADEPCFGTELRGPRCDVGRLPAGAHLRLGAPLDLRRAGAVDPGDHVEQEVAKAAEAHT